MKDLWSKMERYEKKIAAVVVVLAVIVLVSTRFDRVDEGGMVNTGQNTVETRPVASGKHAFYRVHRPEDKGYRFIVVKSGNCYTIGSDDGTGWLANGCDSLERARERVTNMNQIAIDAQTRSTKTWEVVE